MSDADVRHAHLKRGIEIRLRSVLGHWSDRLLVAQNSGGGSLSWWRRVKLMSATWESVRVSVLRAAHWLAAGTEVTMTPRYAQRGQSLFLCFQNKHSLCLVAFCVIIGIGGRKGIHFSSLDQLPSTSLDDLVFNLPAEGTTCQFDQHCMRRLATCWQRRRTPVAVGNVHPHARR